MSKKIPNKTAKSRTKPQSGAFSITPACIQDGEINRTLPLYRFVYASQTSLFLVLLLLSSFFLQGVERVYANEIAEVTTETSLVIDIDTSAQVLAEEGSVPESVSETIPETAQVFTEVVSTATSEDTIVAEQSLAETEELELVDENPSITDTVLPLDEDDTSENVSAIEGVSAFPEDQIAEEVTEGGVFNEENSSNEAVEDEMSNNVPETPADEQADLLDDVVIDTTVVATGTVVAAEVLSYTESDSVFSFSKAECTELATGSFYCHKPQENELKDALYAAPDTDGDLEIFLVRAGIQTQITSNTIDDAAPYYDQNSHTIVWHRLIDDRYQIVSYDIEGAIETVLTHTGENNMEPTRQGEYTVWQRWIDGGWNIILHDGQSEKQITRTTSHNVAPYIHGSLVVWNRHDQVNDKTIEMYDIISKTYVTVEDPDGMSVSNPRMVFVYDSLHPNGDIVTKGYDVLAKKFIELDSLPRELPEEIPESDSTGETRALIQLKPSGKSEIEEVLPVPDAASATASSSTVIATTSTQLVLEALTLDLTVATATEAMPEVSISFELPPEQLDLVIEPFIATSSMLVESVQE